MPVNSLPQLKTNFAGPLANDSSNEHTGKITTLSSTNLSGALRTVRVYEIHFNAVFLMLYNKDLSPRGHYKTWTLDSGLDRGLDSGLNNGPR